MLRISVINVELLKSPPVIPRNVVRPGACVDNSQVTPLIISNFLNRSESHQAQALSVPVSE